MQSEQSKFPHGETLGVVLSFLTTSEKLEVHDVSQDFSDALQLPHAWGETLEVRDLTLSEVKKLLASMPSKTPVRKMVLSGTFDSEESDSKDIDSTNEEFDDYQQFLDFYEEEFIKDFEIFGELIAKCPMLQHLDLDSCEGLEFSRLKNLGGIPLRHLSMRGCHYVTDSSLKQLSGMPLQYLDLQGCSQITDAGLKHLRGMSLQHLNMGGCFRITDAGLEHLRGMPLQHLDLTSCHGITTAGLVHLSDMLLQHLDLTLCSKIINADSVRLAGVRVQNLIMRTWRDIAEDVLARHTEADLARLAEGVAACPAEARSAVVRSVEGVTACPAEACPAEARSAVVRSAVVRSAVVRSVEGVTACPAEARSAVVRSVEGVTACPAEARSAEGVAARMMRLLKLWLVVCASDG